MTPNKHIPIEATPIACRDDRSLEAGHAVVISPKTRMATPVMASKTHAILKRTRSLFLIVANPTSRSGYLDRLLHCVVIHSNCHLSDKKHALPRLMPRSQAASADRVCL